MDYMDPLTERSEYEERVRWLQHLYGSQSATNQPNQTSHLASHLLIAVGSQLVSLGERLQPHTNVPASSSH